MYRAAISAPLIVLLASTGAIAASVITENPVQTQEVQPPEAASSAEHGCCHPMAYFKVELMQPKSSSEMPCGRHHSCCLSSAPEYSAAVPATLTWERQGAAHNSVVDETALFGFNLFTLHKPPSVHLLRSSRFSTVLRI